MRSHRRIIRSEWFWQLPQLPLELRREAGLIASREGLHEWAIFTMSGDELIRQYEARFPLLHTAAVEQEARRTGLPVNWVYGLIRAESAWNANARSPVGARGLMQLLPSTARDMDRAHNYRRDPAPLFELLPGFIYQRVRDGLAEFGKQMRGFHTAEASVVATESRTSSPIRIPRDAATYMHPDVLGLFPCAEGAGYAGGILSAAMDGQNVGGAVAGFLGIG